MIKNDLTDILDAIDAEWLLGREGLTYKVSYGRSGRQLHLKTCPFCSTSEWKVYVNAETMLGNCFSGSCPQRTWNKWTFMKGLFDCEGRQLVDLLKSLAREQGWRPKLENTAITLADLNTLKLPESTPAWQASEYPEYLARRGIFLDVAEHFGFYYSDTGKWTYLDPRGFEVSQDYSKRILVPIFDLNGEMVSFQGRDVTGEAERRYLFPPGFASAGAYLYNAFQATAQTSTLVISEGVFDVAKVKVALNSDPRFDNYLSIGTFGMHLSSGNPSGDDQFGRLRTLKSEFGIKNIVFLWDGERKAIKAAVQAAIDLTSSGFNVKVGLIPDGKDPGSCRVGEIVQAIDEAEECRGKLDALRLLRRVNSGYKTP